MRHAIIISVNEKCEEEEIMFALGWYESNITK